MKNQKSRIKNQNLSTREEILKEAGELFARRGYFGVSMQEIANELKITKAALYYHFESKEKLFLEILEKTFTHLLRRLSKAAATAANPAETLFRVIDGYLNFAFENPQASLFYAKEAGEGSAKIQKLTDGIHQKISSFFEDIFKAAAAEEKEQQEAVSQLTLILLGVLANPLGWGKKEIEKTARFLSRLLTANQRSG